MRDFDTKKTIIYNGYQKKRITPKARSHREFLE